MWPTKSRCVVRRHAQVAGEQDVQARGDVAGAGADREQADVAGRSRRRRSAPGRPPPCPAASPRPGSGASGARWTSSDTSSSSGLTTACRVRTPGVGEDPLGQRPGGPGVVPGEEAVPQLLLRRPRRQCDAEPAMVAVPLASPRLTAYQRAPIRPVRIPAERRDAEPVGADVARWPAAASRTGRRGRAVPADGRGGSPTCRPPPASTPRPRPPSCRRAASPATPTGWSRSSPGASSTRRAASQHRQPGGGDRGVGPADPGPHGRQVAQLARVDVLDRGVHRGLGDADVDGGVAGHQPVRHQLGDHQGQALDAAEQRAGRHGRRRGAGRASAVARMPSESQVCSTRRPVASAGTRNWRDHRLVGGAAGGDQVGVRVPGAGAERLGALDVVAAVDRLVARGRAGTAGSRRRARSSPRAYQVPLAAASASRRSRAASASSGTPSASASSSVTAPSAPVTEACMLKTSAVAPLPRASS